MKFLTALSLFLLLAVPAARGQGCYGGSYAPQQQAFSLQAVQCGVQSQVVNSYATVQVPVTTLQTVQVPVQTVVQTYVPQTLAVSQCGASLGYAQSFGAANYGHSVGFSNRLVVNRGLTGNFGQFNQAIIGGGGISVSAQDRRGTQVIANGQNSVRIRRDFLGRIRGADADRPRGFLGF